jgi:hypothetical protein
LFYLVIAGLDPAIHDEAQRALTVSMDARHKAGHDSFCCAIAWLTWRAVPAIHCYKTACPNLPPDPVP